MGQSTMKWTSRGMNFGLVTPESGGRDIFVRFSPADVSCYISDGHGGIVVKNPNLTT